MSVEQNKLTLEIMEQFQKAPEDFKLLKRIPYTKYDVDSSFPIVLAPAVGDEKTMIILDTETTGLECSQGDVIIELAMVKVAYSPSEAKVTSIIDIYDEFEDPGRPIDPNITKLTGITNEDVQGQHLDDRRIAMLTSDSPLIVAHNAAFDRPFFEKRFPQLENLPWVCSFKEIPWRQYDFGSAKLEFIAYKTGYFYDAHRADIDCLALLWILNNVPNALQHLLTSADANNYVIYAWRSPFELKDDLKSRNYRWNAELKVWSKSCANDNVLTEERAFLAERYDPMQKFVQVVGYTVFNRYKLIINK